MNYSLNLTADGGGGCQRRRRRGARGTRRGAARRFPPRPTARHRSTPPTSRGRPAQSPADGHGAAQLYPMTARGRRQGGRHDQQPGSEAHRGRPSHAAVVTGNGLSQGAGGWGLACTPWCRRVSSASGRLDSTRPPFLRKRSRSPHTVRGAACRAEDPPVTLTSLLGTKFQAPAGNLTLTRVLSGLSAAQRTRDAQTNSAELRRAQGQCRGGCAIC